MENTEKTETPTPERQKAVYPRHWRRTFAVPLNEQERAFLQNAARQDGKPLATWIRDAAKAVAEIQAGSFKPAALPAALPSDTPTPALATVLTTAPGEWRPDMGNLPTSISTNR